MRSQTPDARRDGGPQTVPIPAPPEGPGTGPAGRLPEKHLVQQAAAPQPDHPGGPGRRKPGRRLSTCRPDRRSRSASQHCINRPSTTQRQFATED